MTKKVTTLFVLFSLAVPASVFAQPGNPGSAPIGGVVYLLMAAVGLAFVSLRKKNR
ncbi:MAG: hypothetical protein IPM71_00050 [Bacteroidota bacterium]|nr:MAG: hypothetical protein IPM71_00050 [Bacteroidota bacterium]